VIILSFLAPAQTSETSIIQIPHAHLGNGWYITLMMPAELFLSTGNVLLSGSL
jgi:hypothetical protein